MPSCVWSHCEWGGVMNASWQVSTSLPVFVLFSVTRPPLPPPPHTHMHMLMHAPACTHASRHTHTHTHTQTGNPSPALLVSIYIIFQCWSCGHWNLLFFSWLLYLLHVYSFALLLAQVSWSWETIFQQGCVHGGRWSIRPFSRIQFWVLLMGMPMLVSLSEVRLHMLKSEDPNTERFKWMLIYFNMDTQYAYFWGNPLYQATKWHLNNRSKMKNERKRLVLFSLSFLPLVQCLEDMCVRVKINKIIKICMSVLK